MRIQTVPLLIVLVGGGLLAAAFLFGGPRSAVNWEPLRAVAIESDDWGLPGFVPGADAWDGLDRTRLDTGRFPEVYWLSTLEDGAMVAGLSEVLARHRGRDGHPAVLQPNYVVSSLDYSEGNWTCFDLPDLPPAYERPDLWAAVDEGIRTGVWYPEFHAAWHYDPDLRKRDALSDDLARQATGRGIMLFPGSERAKELGAWRSPQDLQRELDHSLAVFQDLFGRTVGSVMAPDYHWDAGVEAMWAGRELTVIQGKREQINPSWGTGKVGRLVKYVVRHWDRLRYPGRTYLERNCRLEPVQAVDPAAVVADCVAATRRAWAAGEPAIVESHRVNFAHADRRVVASGQSALDRYLEEIVGNFEPAPLFVTDHEIAQLKRGGTSWVVRGGVVVVRNATRSRKVVPVPVEALALAAAQKGTEPRAQGTVLVAVPGQSSIDLFP